MLLEESDVVLGAVLDLEREEWTAGILVGPDLSVVGFTDLVVVWVARVL